MRRDRADISAGLRRLLPVTSFERVADVEVDDRGADEHDGLLAEEGAQVPGYIIHRLFGGSDERDQERVLIDPAPVVVKVASFDYLHGEGGAIAFADVLQNGFVFFCFKVLFMGVFVAKAYIDSCFQHDYLLMVGDG
ncbi:MAG TPA: hypothetical protein DCG37_02085, partial [Lachnospiraceae bacterium]|nr:hypothetical protein [Lachnospiraceae bacterium]